MHVSFSLFLLSFPDLVHCTNEPNVSIPQLANLLIERSQNTNWVVVYKALVTVHHLMCYGNEVSKYTHHHQLLLELHKVTCLFLFFYLQRFTQYLASSNSTFQLNNFLDKSGVQGRFHEIWWVWVFEFCLFHTKV